MANPYSNPTILLASPDIPWDKTAALWLKEEQQNIRKVFKRLGYFKIEATSGKNLAEALVNYPYKDHVQVLHLIDTRHGTGDPSQPNLDNQDIFYLLDALKEFPKLQLLVLRGNLYVDELEILLTQGIPSVLLARPGEKQLAKKLYRKLVQGIPLKEVFASYQHPKLSWRAVSFDLELNGITWPDRDLDTQDLLVPPGIYSLEERQDNLNWKVKKPVELTLSSGKTHFARLAPHLRALRYLLAVAMLVGAFLLFLFVFSELDQVIH